MSVQKPHLCLFTDSLQPSGVGEHMLTLAGELRKRFRITFVCPPTPAGSVFLQKADRLGIQTFAIEARDNPDAIAELKRCLQSERVDIFHCHAGISWEGFGGISAAYAAEVPAIVRTEHLPYLLTHPVQRTDHAQSERLVDQTICVSEEVRSSYLAEGVPEYKLAVVRNGVAIRAAEPDRSGLRAELCLPEESRLVLTVGRFSEQKAHSWLLGSVLEVVSREPAAHFVWVGEGELLEWLQGLVEEHTLSEHVTFLGRRSDIPRLMASADLFVLPSLFEGLPLALVEAMLAGLPCIGTQVCGTSETIVDGVTGRLVPPCDPPAMSRAILDGLQPEHNARWGKAGRERAWREFSAERMAAETASVYEEVLAASPRLEESRLVEAIRETPLRARLQRRDT